MIKNEIGYRQTLELLEQFEARGEKDKWQYLPDQPQLYRIYTSGDITQIEQFRIEITEYEQKYEIGKKTPND